MIRFSAKTKIGRYSIKIFIGVWLFLETGGFYSYAQSIDDLLSAGTRISKSPCFEPALIRGIVVHSENPLKFDFVLDRGDRPLQDSELETEGRRMVKYFFAALTVPKDELWVNLSPYEKDRIIARKLGMTVMGRDMLAQDLVLKRMTSSLMSPDEKSGKTFWARIYQRVREEYGTSDIPIETFQKVWIVPGKAVVYEQWPCAFVVASHLRVMLEQDYLAMSRISAKDKARQIKSAQIRGGQPGLIRETNVDAHRLSASIIKEVILPEIEKEVNEGKNFAVLRQIVNTMILAAWYKQKLKGGIMDSIYFDKNKIRGIDLKETNMAQKFYQKYIDAFQKGIFNFIREDFDEINQSYVPRKYFSGGELFSRYFDPDGVQTIINTRDALDNDNPLTRADKKGRLYLMSVAGHGLRSGKTINGDWGKTRTYNKPVSSAVDVSDMALSKTWEELVGLTQMYVDRLSRGDSFPLDKVDVFFVMGNPDLDSFLRFAGIWKSLTKKIPIVVAGGRGRGTKPLIEKVLAYYARFGDSERKLTGSQIQKLLADDTVEADVINIIFEKEGIPSGMIQKESRPSANTYENFSNSKQVIQGLVHELRTQPAIALVTSPPLLLRAKVIAKKMWNNSSWNIFKVPTYQLDVSLFSGAELIPFIGYIAGYPQAYRKKYDTLNPNDEFHGTQANIDPLSGTVELMDADWELLSKLQESFGRFLQSRSDILYDQENNVLTLASKNATGRSVETQPEKKAGSPVGGIDINPEYFDLRIKRDINKAPEPLDKQMINYRDIDGILPLIINIASVKLSWLSDKQTKAP